MVEKSDLAKANIVLLMAIGEQNRNNKESGIYTNIDCWLALSLMVIEKRNISFS
jgi:hypothetical protein